MNNVSKKPVRSSDTTEADVREDEEQATKLQEIIDLLVAAGYFRAKIKGLSDFDKVIGGMTWCIISCSFDVDVDLLFNENLTIGQKISLTEKIVAVLPKMNCPHRIEPHQIQGLDCIHIFPVIQWLVKRSMETRKETAGFLRSFAINQFNKKHSFFEDLEKSETLKGNVMNNVLIVKKSYEPRRLYKYKEGAVKKESTKFLSTLLEYEAILEKDSSTDKKETKISSEHPKIQELSSTATIEKKAAEEIKENLAVVDGNLGRLSSQVVGNIVGIQAQEVAKVTEQFANASLSKSEDDSSAIPRVLVQLQKQKTAFKERIEKLTEEKSILLKKISKLLERTNESIAKRNAMDQSLKDLHEKNIDKNEKVFNQLEELLTVYDGLKHHEHDFREQCTLDFNQFQEKLQEFTRGESGDENGHMKELEKQREAVAQVSLQLAKKNRLITTLIRQLDDVPGRLELNQYQQRFLELYNKVSANHNTQAKFYVLHNTLDDYKMYLVNCVTLLDSIQDNYQQAMTNASSREEFLKQLEEIVMGIMKNKDKVTIRWQDLQVEQLRKDEELRSLHDLQHKYNYAVKQLRIECRKNEALLAQLQGP